MDLRYALLADAAVPAEGGKLNLIGAGVEAIFTPSVPAVHAVLTLAMKVGLTRDEASEQHSFEVSVTAPDGTQIARGSGSVPVVETELLDRLPEGETLGVPMLLPITNLVLPVFGTYEVAVQWDGTPLVALPLTVARLPEE